MALFYIRVENQPKCFVNTVKLVCKKMGYTFSPNNKKYYLVNTIEKTCVGIEDIKSGLEILTDATSYSKLKDKFGKTKIN